jgi:purine nucleosidase
MKRKVIILVVIFFVVSSFSCNHEIDVLSERNKETRQPIIFIHGGTIDDYVSYLLLTTMEEIDLQASIIVNADTIPDHAMQIHWKIMEYIGDSGIPVGLSNARGWNAFPWEYRSDAIRHNNIEALGDIKDKQEWPPHPSGDILLQSQLTEAIKKGEPVTLLITTPLTPLSDLLREHPELDKGIARMIWMGGAINVDGNLDSNVIPAEVANQKAEWNAFWDPQAVDWIFQNTSFPLVLFPLDVTDQATITKEFMQKLKQQASDYRYSTLVYQSYELTSDEPFYEMWNSVTTVYVTHPEFFEKPVPMNLVIETEGLHQGTINQSDEGRQVEVVLNINQKEAFYEYVLGQLRRSFAHSESEGEFQQ